MTVFRVGYGIMSYRRPKQLELLARRIRQLSPSAEIIIHHDARASERPWRGGLPTGVHLLDPIAVTPGTWSQVEAQLRLIEHGFARLGCDWVVLIGGEDRPVADLGRWEKELQFSETHAVVQLWSLTIPEPAPATVTQPLQRVLRGVTNQLGRTSLKRIPSPPWWFTWAGEPFLALSRTAGQQVLAGDADFVSFCQSNSRPDQRYLHGLIGRSQLKIDVRDLRFQPPGGAVREADLLAIKASGAIFAGNFDTSVDPDVLALIERIDRDIDASRTSDLAR